MVAIHPEQALGGLNRLISDVLQSRDITPAEHERVTWRYNELGDELDLHWSPSRGHNM